MNFSAKKCAGRELLTAMLCVLASACSSDGTKAVLDGGSAESSVSEATGGSGGASGAAGSGGMIDSGGGIDNGGMIGSGGTTLRDASADGSMDSGTDAQADASVDAAPESGVRDAMPGDASPDGESDAATPLPADCAGIAVATNFTGIYTNLLSQTCARCHAFRNQGTGDQPLQYPPQMAFDRGLDLAYTDLLSELDGGPLGAPAQGYACGATGERRVVPGNPTMSLIIQKLEGKNAAGAPVCGQRMPYMLPSICEPVIQGIRKWIADGAPKN